MRTTLHPTKVLLIAAALVAGSHLASAGEPKTVIALAAGDGNFKTFGKLLAAADYVKTLEGPGPYTVFAPTDKAFAKIKKVDLDNLMKDKMKLTRFILHHVHQGKKSTKDLKNGKFKTLRGLELNFTSKDDGLWVNEARISKPDMTSGNGYLHGIDGILGDIEISAPPPAPDPNKEAPNPNQPEKREKAEPAKEDAPTFHSLSATTLDGREVSFAEFKDKVVLCVNVASECGFTPQYEGLQKLHAELAAKGFTVLGFPSNEFGGQEPGDSAAIKKFCEGKYKVTFPVFEKVVTKPGADQSPIYAFISKGRAAPDWNFCKYLVGKDGKVVKFWKSATKPDDAELRTAIDKALK
ncbi:MAG: fasciclin domain-containing protein [Planctomycetota bacterium]